MGSDEKRSVDRALWLKWLSRYSHRLHQEIETATDTTKVSRMPHFMVYLIHSLIRYLSWNTCVFHRSMKHGSAL